MTEKGKAHRDFVDLIELLNEAWNHEDYEKFLKSSKGISLALEEAKAEIAELKKDKNSLGRMLHRINEYVVPGEYDSCESAQKILDERDSLKDRLAVAIATLKYCGEPPHKDGLPGDKIRECFEKIIGYDWRTKLGVKE